MDGKVKIGLIGADGAMGKIITNLAAEEKDLDIVAAFTEPGSPNIGKNISALAGAGDFQAVITPVDALEEVLLKEKPDVIIDFTVASATERNAPVVLKHGVPMVIGTTALSDAFMKTAVALMEEKEVPCVVGSNMAVGMNVFMKVVSTVARALQGWDTEIIEAHHHRKKDSPSGTAMTLGEIVAAAWNKSLDDIAKHGRPRGPAPREKGDGELGIHAVRAGDIVGDHTVLFAGAGERIELVHRAHDRSCFAAGALAAARFLVKRKLAPGLHGMDEVLGLS